MLLFYNLSEQKITLKLHFTRNPHEINIPRKLIHRRNHQPPKSSHRRTLYSHYSREKDINQKYCKILQPINLMMNSVEWKLLLMMTLILRTCSVHAAATSPHPIRESEIQPGALVLFHQTRRQKSRDLDQRAQELSMELACIMDPPFDTERRRVNIQKVFDPAVKVGVKPKHLVLAKCMFDDESVLAPSPNQHLKLEIYKLPNHQKPFQMMRKQLILADQLYHCDEAFLVYSKETLHGFQNLLRFTSKCEVFLSVDVHKEWCNFPDSPHHLIRFLDKILNPSHLDKDTFDDFRDLVANYVFAYYANFPPDTFQRSISSWSRSLVRNVHNPKSIKILRIFYRNLQRHQPKECPKLDVLRDDFVNETMVYDMFTIITRRFKMHEATLTMNQLSDLYRLMDSDAEATRAIWDCGRETWSESGWLVKIADLVCGVQDSE